MKIGCHCVLFGPAIETDTDRVLGDIAKTGCQGVEIGARFFSLEKAGLLKALLEKNGLALAGLHIGTPLVQWLDAPKENLEALVKVAQVLQDMPERNIIMTGMIPDKNSAVGSDGRLGDAAEVSRLAKQLDDSAQLLKKDYDVQLHYHNHSWEFQNNALIFKALLGTAHLKIALDTGWAMLSGYDAADLMQSHPGHFGYIHLRDYSKDIGDGTTDFETLQQHVYVDIGKGDVDYPKLVHCAEAVLGSSGWAIVEYETGAPDYTRYREAVAYIEKLRGE